MLNVKIRNFGTVAVICLQGRVSEADMSVLEDAGVELRLTNAIERVRRMIQVARLNSVFEIASREALRTASQDGDLALPLQICA